jgi:NADH dehydrogenase
VNAVTGVFSYTGAHVAERLLADGARVRTLSRAPYPAHPLASRVEYARLQFDDADALTQALRGATTLYNTYWVRFPRGGLTWDRVVANTRTLLRAAGDAGVERVVHVSVAGADTGSDLPYYRHKALAEQEVRDCGIPYAIVRPTLVFAAGDILLNNIAWVLRRFPLFLVAGRGDYRVQPVAAEDVAEICVAAAGSDDPASVRDAAGPVSYPYERLVRLVRSAIGVRSRIVHVPPRATVAAASLVGRALADDLVTRDELAGLMGEALTSREPPAGRRSFDEWLQASGPALGRRYASERKRNWTP